MKFITSDHLETLTSGTQADWKWGWAMLVFSAGQGSIVAVKFLQITVTYHRFTFSKKGLLHSEPKRQEKKAVASWESTKYFCTFKWVCPNCVPGCSWIECKFSLLKSLWNSYIKACLCRYMKTRRVLQYLINRVPQLMWSRNSNCE